MTNVDAPNVLQQWFAEWDPRWRSQSIRAGLRLPDGAGLNKAVATLEAPTHVGSVTVWGGGTLEFIVLELATRSEVIMSDKEYRTAQELQSLLDGCADSFSGIVRSGR
jgi:hypothetical protein